MCGNVGFVCGLMLLTSSLVTRRETESLTVSNMPPYKVTPCTSRDGDVSMPLCDTFSAAAAEGTSVCDVTDADARSCM